MQFKIIVATIAAFAVGSAIAGPVATPDELSIHSDKLDTRAKAPNNLIRAEAAPSVQQMQNSAKDFAHAHAGHKPNAYMLKAAQELGLQHQGFWNFPDADSSWSFWDCFNSYCWDQWPAQFDTWNVWCTDPSYGDWCGGYC
ncbi:hypothetical protein AC578_1404 [Pseudocercospora eumusae]|uniref:SCP domain-containing protein n=1 Tax=Pseudocercospora eumusae TaxID=321146 RepID=A0A139HUH8_9PEZI|nr:hypothetical protein AC578_1404 [Pseudocercospora eumusae]